MTWVLILVIGFRYQVGGDWANYVSFFEEAKGAGFSESVLYYKDPGYYFFNWIFANAGFEVWSINLFIGFISIYGLMALVERQPMPWVSLVVAIPYIVVVVFMGYTRQAAALGLTCLALISVEDRRTWRFVFFAIAATSFHKSAILILPFFILTVERIRLWHWILLGVIGIGAFGVFVLETLEAHWTNYVEEGMESDGALIRIFLNIPAAFLLIFYKKRLGLVGDKGRPWLVIAFMSVASLALVNQASTVVDRLALYLLPLQMVVYGRVYRLFEPQSIRAIACIVVLFVYFCVQFVWLNYARYAENWVPYKFYPLIQLLI